MPVPVADGNREGTVGLAQQFRERRFDLPESLGVGLCVWPPWVNGLVRQLFGAVAKDLGERGVHLDDGSMLVANKETFLQGIHQSGAPAGMMAAQPRQFDVGAHPGEELRGRERFDKVVVGAGMQAFDGGFLPGAGGQQQDGNGGGSQVATQCREQLKTVQPRHHDVADNQVRDPGADGIERLLAVLDFTDLDSRRSEAAWSGIHACRRCRRRSTRVPARRRPRLA